MDSFVIPDRDFSFLSKLVHDKTGIVLSEKKKNLVASRLSKRLRELQCGDFAGYIKFLQGEEGDDEIARMINAITTNHTKFFREPHHFKYLHDTILPKVKENIKPGAKKRLRIWSAGCSSGQEPYSIAMTLASCFPDLNQWDAKILATDLDTEMVAHAYAGEYVFNSLDPMPDDMNRKFYQILEKGNNGQMRIQMGDDIKKLITFKQLNLLGPWPMKGPFDVIFCRNVVIYFNKDTQRVLFDRYAEMLKPDGWLFIGHSESLYNVSNRFQSVGTTIYQRIS